jgi:hypothetical membrane protein
MTVRLGCVAASAAVFAVAVIIIGSLTPGYNQWSDAVSRLASPGERWALAARAAFAVYGLLVITGASALRQSAGRHGRTLAACLTLYGVVAIVAGVAPKDQPGAAHTAVSQVHVAAAIVAGALAIGAMTLVARYGPAQATRRAAAAMASLTALAAVVFKDTWGTQLYGVSERVLLGLGMCWISALAARAFQRQTSIVPELAAMMCPGRTDGELRDEKAALDLSGLLRRGVHDLDGQPHRDERAAGDPPGPAHRPGGPGVDRQRLHAHLRGAAADRRGAG